jgi:alpha-glucosidase
MKLGEGSFDWLAEFTNQKTLGYRNGNILVIHNFGYESIDLPAGELLLSSTTESAQGQIAPNETVWLKAQASN